MSRHGGTSAPEVDKRLTLPQVMDHMRTGQLTNGPLQPYKWLEYSAKPPTEQELKIKSAMDSCTFKSVMSLVVGVWLVCWSYIPYMNQMHPPFTHTITPHTCTK